MLPVTLRTQLKPKPTDETALGFGKVFTDYMYSCVYNTENGWHDAKIVPYEPIALDPSAMVIHYGQSIFEGLKAYINPQGEPQLFRPLDNFLRLNRSCERLSIPKINPQEALDGLLQLIALEKDWIPRSAGTSLYIRPFIFATDPYVGVKVSSTYLFLIILSPVASYYAAGLQPVRIYVEDEYVRAVKGGMGFAKTAGNYAASLLSGDIAAKKGFSQVLWLDGIERKYIEEVGAMNIFFRIGDELITPPLEGSILAGITRDSVMQLAKSFGITVLEKRITIEEVFAAAQNGTLQEAFGTGTAAVISPVGELAWGEESVIINNNKIGPLAQRMYDTLTGIQLGTQTDLFNWIVPVK